MHVLTSFILYFLDECSGYYFRYNGLSWNRANASCAEDKTVLVSIESNEEWEHLKNITIKKGKNNRWYIGLKYFSSSKQWCWITNSGACLNETLSISGTWRWSANEPNNFDKAEYCVEMLPGGKFNNIVCGSNSDGVYRGYICEKKVGEDQTRHLMICFAYITVRIAFSS